MNTEEVPSDNHEITVNTPETTAPAPPVDLPALSQAVADMKSEIQKVIVGQDATLDLLLAGLLSGGHVLLEGVPGIAKTLIAKMLAQTLSVNFSRIQFTPDLMPTDVVGTTVFNMKTSEFAFNRGPVFSNIVLIDEINRAPAKTQAALFEVMEERQVTVDGITHPMDFPFFVVATQNPIEQEGTYKLPEAQLDRFVFRLRMHYPAMEDELRILNRFREDFSLATTAAVKQVMTRDELHRFRGVIERIHISDQLVDYIARISVATRNHADLFLGASPRASLAMLRTAKAMAAFQGRPFVTPDDIRMVSSPVLNHRILLTPEKEMEGLSADDVIRSILQSIDVPR